MKTKTTILSVMFILALSMGSALSAQEFVNLLPAGDMEDASLWRINKNGNSVTMAIEDGEGRDETKGMSVEVTALDGNKTFYVIINDELLSFTQDDSVTVSFWAKASPSATNDTAFVMPFIQGGQEDGYPWMNMASGGFGVIPNNQWQFFEYDTVITSGTYSTYNVKFRGASVGNFVIDDFQIGLTVEETAVGMDDVVVNAFSLYPNPSENTLNIRTENFVEKYSIYNACGSKVMEGSGSTIDVSPLESGMYFIRMNDSSTSKFIKR
ncbi:MAG TPA: T9SS type A sorting domain-containing protein [Bacteroidales bacterium]|nr:T9SS type A sorting domain-containing protein [Bacteroidales bacterium]